MKIVPKQTHYESGPNMTPLVDVVMVILIFLMLAGSFGSGEHYMVTLGGMVSDKGVASDKPPPPDFVPPVMVEVTVNRDGGVRLPGSATAVQQDAKLVELLTAKFDAVKASGTDPKNIQLILKPDANTEWEKLAPVYDAGLRAKFLKVGFAPVK